MTKPFGRETLKAVASTVPFEDLQDVDWKAAPFLEYGRMGLSDINMRGVEVEGILTRNSVRPPSSTKSANKCDKSLFRSAYSLS